MSCSGIHMRSCEPDWRGSTRSRVLSVNVQILMCPAPTGPARCNTNLRKIEKKKKRKKEKKKKSLVWPPPLTSSSAQNPLKRDEPPFPARLILSPQRVRQPDSQTALRGCAHHAETACFQFLQSFISCDDFLVQSFCPTRLCLCFPLALAFRLLIFPPLTFFSRFIFLRLRSHLADLDAGGVGLGHGSKRHPPPSDHISKTSLPNCSLSPHTFSSDLGLEDFIAVLLTCWVGLSCWSDLKT